jgi:hypothetical protein
MYIYCKSVRPTAGRIVGNIAASAAAGAMAVYSPGFFFFLTAFVSDNITLVLLYIIDPQTYEVVAFQRFLKNYDIHKSELIKNLADEILTLLEKKN